MRPAGLLLAFSLTSLAQTPKLPGHVKLSPGYSLSPTAKSFVPAPVNTPPKADTRCAHILVHKVSPDIDPKIAIENRAAPDHGSRMPVYKAMPVCPDDVR